ncbi:MAG: response regulator [Leptolyngbya sp. SIO1E4]|nr:response regulator [Leptolyngbya sp. SIO1E4]
MRILLVDDDEALMETLAESLIRQRYAVDIAVDGETAQEFLALFSYDLVVLDIRLPDAEGTSLCQQFRQQGVTCPILMLTAKDTSADKVQALDAGADDYVVKPFDFGELCARIRALLRRDSHVSTSDLQWGDLTLKPDTFEVFYGEHQLHTTPKEYALLELFLRHPNQVFSLNAIIEDIWLFEDPPSGDAVRTHIKGLRQKLKAGGAPKNFIETVYGLGYRLKALDSDVVPAQDILAPESQKPTESEIIAAVAKAWEVHQGTMQERLNVLEAAAAAMDVGQLSAELQHTSRSHAHKLAGSLGCFGFSEGSRIARELEHLLQLEVPLIGQHASQVSELVQSLRQNLASGSSQEVISAAISSAPQLLVVGADESLSQRLTDEAAAVGIRSMGTTNLTQAHAILQAHAPAGVLLWLDQAHFEEGMLFLEAIAQCSDKIPVLMVTDIQDFQQRLQMVQQGADVILPTSTAPRHAVKTVQQTLQIDRTSYKIVVVDDDVEVLDFLRTLLLPWGIQPTTLDDPSQLWSTLEAVQPQLLVLDVEMPEANGLELCQVLRADEKWRHLPVLFLTVHKDDKTQQQAFNVGADDFISKSAMTTGLPNRIVNRLQRAALNGTARSQL